MRCATSAMRWPSSRPGCGRASSSICFARAGATSCSTASVVPQILAMARTLKLGVIVEGVETTVQERALRELGVELVQGWLYGKPMSAAELMSRVEEETAAQSGGDAVRRVGAQAQSLV